MPDSRSLARQPRKIAVRGHNAVAVHHAGIKDIHGVNDHGRIRGILAGGVAVLLHGNDGILQQHMLPGSQLGIRPVAVDPLVGGHAAVGDLIQNDLNVFV